MLSGASFGSTAKPSHLRSPLPVSPSSPTSAIFAGLDDELRDIRRVHSQGQEEDLRYALDRLINKVEELSSLLKTAYKTQTELETQLNLAKSNLQLVISNNEMLEEALTRETPGSARDVGWRRWSAREAHNHTAERTSEDRPRSFDYGTLNESGTPTAPSSAAVVLINGVRPPAGPPPSATPRTPMTGQENRFFRFRFTSGSKTPALESHPTHLTSPSLPSLVPNAREKEIEGLQEQLERERQAHKTAEEAKAALEAELESLSQALFEEANKMVANERMKRAEAEEELKEVRQEKDVLKEALRLVEGENGRLRSAGTSSDLPSRGTVPDTPSPLTPVPPSRSMPSPQALENALDGKITPRVTTFNASKIPDHLAGFLLEPAPFTRSSVIFHRKTISKEKPTADEAPTVEAPAIHLTESVVAASPSSIPLMPDEPSPWADASS